MSSIMKPAEAREILESMGYSADTHEKLRERYGKALDGLVKCAGGATASPAMVRHLDDRGPCSIHGLTACACKGE